MRGKTIACAACGRESSHPVLLRLWQRLAGNPLVPVEVREAESHSVWVPGITPRRYPYVRLMSHVLGVALEEEFRGLHMDAEGMIVGVLRGTPHRKNASCAERMAFAYCSEELELRACGYISHAHKVLSWYAEALRVFLTEELKEGATSYGTGRILLLRAGERWAVQEANTLLWVALHQKTGSRVFANSVIEETKCRFPGAKVDVPAMEIARAAPVLP